MQNAAIKKDRREKKEFHHMTDPIVRQLKLYPNSIND